MEQLTVLVYLGIIVLDIKLDKAFYFGLGKNDRPISMDVYVWVKFTRC